MAKKKSSQKSQKAQNKILRIIPTDGTASHFPLAKTTFVELIFRRDFVEANDSEKCQSEWPVSLVNCEVRPRAGLDPLPASQNFFVSRM